MKAKPPAHLRDETKKWYRAVLRCYQLEEHHVKVLISACEALDRGTEAREIIAEEGAYLLDRFGQRKSHPAVAVERDCKVVFARLLRELALDVEGPGANRPPGIGR